MHSRQVSRAGHRSAQRKDAYARTTVSLPGSLGLLLKTICHESGSFRVRRFITLLHTCSQQVHQQFFNAMFDESRKVVDFYIKGTLGDDFIEKDDLLICQSVSDFWSFYLQPQQSSIPFHTSLFIAEQKWSGEMKNGH